MAENCYQLKNTEFDLVSTMQSQNLQCSNEGFRCDPKTSVRGNLILFDSYEGKVTSSFDVLKYIAVISCVGFGTTNGFLKLPFNIALQTGE